MENICAVIDAQGFNLSFGFVAREIAITSSVITQCQELNPNLIWSELNDEDIAIVNYTTFNLTGLHLLTFNDKDHAFLPASSDIGSLLKFWYNEVISHSPEDKYLFAFKNPFLKPILDNQNIPSFDLSQVEGFPNVKELNKKYGTHYLCAYHKRPPRGISFTCAYRKVNYLLREIEDRLKCEIV